MFDAVKALSNLKNKRFSSFHDLKSGLEQVRAQNLSQIPVEFGTRELYMLARRNSWIKKDESGAFVVRVS